QFAQRAVADGHRTTAKFPYFVAIDRVQRETVARKGGIEGGANDIDGASDHLGVGWGKELHHWRSARRRLVAHLDLASAGCDVAGAVSSGNDDFVGAGLGQ